MKLGVEIRPSCGGIEPRLRRVLIKVFVWSDCYASIGSCFLWISGLKETVDQLSGKFSFRHVKDQYVLQYQTARVSVCLFLKICLFHVPSSVLGLFVEY